MDYLEFDVAIDVGTGGTYPVAVRSPAGEARGELRLPADLDSLVRHARAAVPDSSGPGRHLATVAADGQDGGGRQAPLQQVGQALFDALLHGEVFRAYDRSRLLASQAAKGLRIKLRVLSPEVAVLPWELLYDAQQRDHLGLSRRTPIVRYLEVPQPPPLLPVAPPLRILGMVASPPGLPPLDVAREQRWMEAAVADLRAAGRLELAWLEGRTWRDLLRATRPARPPWHVFHFIGHGAFDAQTGEGLIVLEDGDGGADAVGAGRLDRLLNDYFPLRLAVLNACEGARGDARDAFSSAAATLIKGGVPAVLAMQQAITDRSAVEFARTFYEALADGLPVDAAVADARALLATTLEWGIPVLYMRSPNGVLFDLQPPAGPTPALLPQLGDEPTTAKTSEGKPSDDSPGREPAQGTLAAEGLPVPVNTGDSPGHEPAQGTGAGPATLQPARAAVSAVTASRVGAVRTLRGHADVVYAVAFAPDGQTLASASRDGTVRLWRVADGTLRGTGEGHTGSVYDVAFAPDGQTVASASRDGTVRLWNVASGVPVLLRTLEGHQAAVYGVAFAPDGQTLASASDDETVRLWATADGALQRTLQSQAGSLYGVAFAPGGQLLAAAAQDGTVRLWRPAGGELLRVLRGHGGPARSLAFTPDGQTLASGSDDYAVRLWRVADGAPLHVLAEHLGRVHGVAFAPSGEVLASGSDDYAVRLWRVADGTPLRRLEDVSCVVYGLAFAPSGQVFACASEDGGVHLWGVP